MQCVSRLRLSHKREFFLPRTRSHQNHFTWVPVNRNRGNIAYMQQIPTYGHSQPTDLLHMMLEIRYEYPILK